jgi:hypothetical protein
MERRYMMKYFLVLTIVRILVTMILSVKNRKANREIRTDAKHPAEFELR